MASQRELDLVVTVHELLDWTGATDEAIEAVIGASLEDDPDKWPARSLDVLVELETCLGVLQKFKRDQAEALKWMNRPNSEIGMSLPKELMLGDSHQRYYLTNRMRAVVEGRIFER